MGKRNTTGGSAHKGLARKFIHSNHLSNNLLRLPENPGEHFAIVSKMLGDGKCRVHVSLDDGSIVELLSPLLFLSVGIKYLDIHCPPFCATAKNN
jgi:hypothetical protein